MSKLKYIELDDIKNGPKFLLKVVLLAESMDIDPLDAISLFGNLGKLVAMDMLNAGEAADIEEAVIKVVNAFNGGLIPNPNR